MIDLDVPTRRRRFVGRVAALAAAMTGVGVLRHVAPLRAEHLPLTTTGGPDDAWLDKLKGKYKTTFDVDAHKNGNALVQGKSVLDAWRDSFGVPNVQPSGPVSHEQTVEALQKRGVVFLVCRNTIAGATRQLVAAGMGTAEEVRESLADGMLPGVIIIPGMIIAFTEMQQRGVAYVYAG